MEMDEVGISYTRDRIRIKFEQGREGNIICLLPSEACSYFLEEEQMTFANEHGNDETFKVCNRGEEGEKLGHPPPPDRDSAWAAMKQQVRRERTSTQGKGIKIRYDMPNYLAKTSLEAGGFGDMQ